MSRPANQHEERAQTAVDTCHSAPKYQDDAGGGRAVFFSDEKYTRAQIATLEALIRKPIKQLVDEPDMGLVKSI